MNNRNSKSAEPPADSDTENDRHYRHKTHYSAKASVLSDEYNPCVWCLNGSFDEIDYIESLMDKDAKAMANKMKNGMRNRYNIPECDICLEKKQKKYEDYDFKDVLNYILNDAETSQSMVESDSGRVYEFDAGKSTNESSQTETSHGRVTIITPSYRKEFKQSVFPDDKSKNQKQFTPATFSDASANKSDNKQEFIQSVFPDNKNESLKNHKEFTRSIFPDDNLKNQKEFTKSVFPDDKLKSQKEITQSVFPDDKSDNSKIQKEFTQAIFSDDRPNNSKNITPKHQHEFTQSVFPDDKKQTSMNISLNYQNQLSQTIFVDKKRENLSKIPEENQKEFYQTVFSDDKKSTPEDKPLSDHLSFSQAVFTDNRKDAQIKNEISFSQAVFTDDKQEAPEGIQIRTESSFSQAIFSDIKKESSKNNITDVQNLTTQTIPDNNSTKQELVTPDNITQILSPAAIKEIHDQNDTIDKTIDLSTGECFESPEIIIAEQHAELKLVMPKILTRQHEGSKTNIQSINSDASSITNRSLQSLREYESIKNIIHDNISSETEDIGRLIDEVRSEMSVYNSSEEDLNNVTSYSAQINEDEQPSLVTLISDEKTRDSIFYDSIIIPEKDENVDTGNERFVNPEIKEEDQTDSDKVTSPDESEKQNMEKKVVSLTLITNQDGEPIKDSVYSKDFMQSVINRHSQHVKVNKYVVNDNNKPIMIAKEGLANKKNNESVSERSAAKETSAKSEGSEKSFRPLSSAEQKNEISAIRKEAEERVKKQSLFGSAAGIRAPKYVKRFVLPRKDKLSYIENIISINDLKSDIILGRICKRGGNGRFQNNWFQLKDVNLTCYNGAKVKISDSDGPSDAKGDLINPDDLTTFFTRKYTIALNEYGFFLSLNSRERNGIFNRLNCKFGRTPENDRVGMDDKSVTHVTKHGEEYKIFLKNNEGNEIYYVMPFLEICLANDGSAYFYRFDAITDFLKWRLAIELRQGKATWPVL